MGVLTLIYLVAPPIVGQRSARKPIEPLPDGIR